MEGTVLKEEDVIENINSNILKGFKTLRKSKPSLYTTARDNQLISINNTSALIYANPTEIDFEGSFKVMRNKLVPIKEDLDIANLEIDKLIHHGEFDKKILKFQKYILDNNIRLNFIEVIPMIKRLLVEYNSFDFYISSDNKKTVFKFKTGTTHETSFITDLIA